MTFLRTWRKSQGETQSGLARRVGENPKTYSAYERGASPLPSGTLARLRALGYDGPSAQNLPEEDLPLTLGDLQREIATLRAFLKPGSGILPKHVERAWELLCEAARAAGHAPPPHRRAAGKWLGKTALRLSREAGPRPPGARMAADAVRLPSPRGRSR